jgi:hypothetical protein
MVLGIIVFSVLQGFTVWLVFRAQKPGYLKDVLNLGAHIVPPLCSLGLTLGAVGLGAESKYFQAVLCYAVGVIFMFITVSRDEGSGRNDNVKS